MESEAMTGFRANRKLAELGSIGAGAGLEGAAKEGCNKTAGAFDRTVR
jgi:hypothetical protein